MRWKKNIGFFERAPDMVLGLRHHALGVNWGKIRRLLNARRRFPVSGHSPYHARHNISFTNDREYFADCFAFHVMNSGDGQRTERFRNAAPQTWAYLERLAENGWYI